MSEKARKVWDDYMERIAATDLGCELGDVASKQTRQQLIDELKVKLADLGEA